MVVLEPALDRLVGVVGAALELGAPAQPLEGDLVRNLESEDDTEVSADLAEHPVERLGLHDRAREPVEDEP